jgi:hypothetical protein
MKHLSDYTQEAQTAAFDKAGAFFAFGTEQFKEKQKEGVKYVSMGAGLICPKDTAKGLHEDLSRAANEGIQADIKENGVNNIIIRELSNYETYYTGDISDTVSALSGYDITDEQVQTVYLSERKNHYDD